MSDWLQQEFGVGKLASALEAPETLNANAFVGAGRRSTPRSRKPSASDTRQLKHKYITTLSEVGKAAIAFAILKRHFQH